MAPNELPTEEAGGNPPWPESVDTLVEGESYERTVSTPSGETTKSVTITKIETRENGARAVVFKHAGGDSS